MVKSSAQDVGTLFSLHGPMVFRRALRLMGRKEDAEEVTQEVFVRVMRSVAQFDGRSSMSTWLYQITTNYCLNQLRDRSRRRELFEQNMLGEEEPQQASLADLLLLRRLLAEADEKQACAAVYVYLDGMSHEEAAELLGVSKRTIGNLIEPFCDFDKALFLRSLIIIEGEFKACFSSNSRLIRNPFWHYQIVYAKRIFTGKNLRCFRVCKHCLEADTKLADLVYSIAFSAVTEGGD